MAEPAQPSQRSSESVGKPLLLWLLDEHDLDLTDSPILHYDVHVPDELSHEAADTPQRGIAAETTATLARP